MRAVQKITGCAAFLFFRSTAKVLKVIAERVYQDFAKNDEAQAIALDISKLLDRV